MTAPSRIRPATRGDAPEIVDLLNACDVAEIGEPDSTPEDLENDWAMEGFDPARDAWVAEGPGGLVGYAYAGDQFRTGELEADLWVHPEHHEPELGGRLLGLAERRAAAARRRARLRGVDARRLLPVHQPRQARPAAAARLRAHAHRVPDDRRPRRGSAGGHGGCDARGPRDPDLPARGRRAGDVRDHERGVRGPLPPQRRAASRRGRPGCSGTPTSTPELWWLAWDDAAGEAAGGVIAYDHGDLGWIQGLGVRRPWRRRGLGAALLAHALAAFAARGQLRVDLGVDAEGATRPLRLYERAGMQASVSLRAVRPGGWPAEPAAPGARRRTEPRAALSRRRCRSRRPRPRLRRRRACPRPPAARALPLP